MEEAAVQAEARLVAIEYLMQRLHVLVYGATGMTLEDIATSHQTILARLRKKAFPSADPVVSDVVASDIHHAVQRQLTAIEQTAREMGLR
jgi:hypothetical protein